MPLGRGSLIVEADAVIPQVELDLVSRLLDRQPHVARVSVLQGVHHSLAGDVVQQEGDRCWELHLVDVGVELHVGVPARLCDEAVDRLGNAGSPQRRTVQVPDQCADPIRGSVLRLLDVTEESLRFLQFAGIEMAARHVDLDREPEQKLREIVVQESGDLQAFVLPLLGHPIRERAEDLLTVLQFFVRLFQRLAPEEHLPSKQ
ncbi:MAG TPA: hypothetical protein VF129_09165, partial [Actinomycetota bacterium]